MKTLIISSSFSRISLYERSRTKTKAHRRPSYCITLQIVVLCLCLHGWKDPNKSNKSVLWSSKLWLILPVMWKQRVYKMPSHNCGMIWFWWMLQGAHLFTQRWLYLFSFFNVCCCISMATWTGTLFLEEHLKIFCPVFWVFLLHSYLQRFLGLQLFFGLFFWLSPEVSLWRFFYQTSWITTVEKKTDSESTSSWVFWFNSPLQRR